MCALIIVVKRRHYVICIPKDVGSFTLNRRGWRVFGGVAIMILICEHALGYMCAYIIVTEIVNNTCLNDLHT